MYIIKVLVLGGIPLHLAVYTVDMLGSAPYLRPELSPLKLFLQDFNHLSDKCLPPGPAGRHQFGNLVVFLGFQVT